MTFNGNRHRYLSGLMMNLLQPSRYCTCRRGQKRNFVFLAYIICVFRMLLSINSKYTPYTVFTDCVSNGGTLFSVRKTTILLSLTETSSFSTQ